MLPTYLPACLPTYLPTNLPTYMPTYLPTHLPTYLPPCPPTYLPTYLPTYPPTYLPTYLQTLHVLRLFKRIATGHFRVAPSQARLSAKPLIWKWFFILMQIKLIFTLSLILKVRVFGTPKRHFSFFHRRYGIFILFFQQKMSPLFFISRSRYLSPVFLIEFRWPAAYSLFFSVFLLLYIPNLWTWQLI